MSMRTTDDTTEAGDDAALDVRYTQSLLTAGALQSAIFSSANFSSIATDANGVMRFQCRRRADAGLRRHRRDEQGDPADISDPRK